MSGYATSLDMEDYFGSEEVLIAFDRDGDGAVDPDAMASALTAAQEEIDSYVAVRYSVPVSPVPGVLVRVACDLAMYHASIGQASMSEDKQTRYDQRVKWLTKLAAGKVSLGNVEELATAKDNAVISSTSEPRRFTRTKMWGL